MEGGWFRELLRRRVPQILGIYIGVAWGAVQVVDWATSRYLLSDHLVDLVAIGALSLLPAVLVLAYMHGAPGRDRWTRLEKVVVPANVIVTAMLLATQIQGKDLGRVAEKVEVTDEEGQVVERLVPKQSARRKLALFFWENESGDPELDWLRVGFPSLLGEDLEQDLFVSTTTPLSSRVLAPLQEAGFEEGMGAPVSLQRQVARRLLQQYFASGEFVRTEEGGFEARLTVYSTDPAREVGSHTVRGTDPMQVIDQLTVAIKPDLEVHKGAARLADDLPVADHFSGDLEAIRHFIEGGTAVAFRNEYPRAIAEWRKAVELDPGFAVAHLGLARLYFVSGANEAAKGAVAAARKNEYRLPERSRFRARALAYQLEQDFDKLIPLHEQWVEIYPADIVALRELANTYLSVGNRVDAAVEAFRRILEVDPGEDEAQLALGQLLQTKGEHAEALSYLERYARAHPESERVQVLIGQLHWNLGSHAEAREAFEKASLLLPGQVQPQVFLALVDMAEGRVDEAVARYLRAEEEATTPADKFVALQYLTGCYLYFGRMGEFSELLPRLFELGARSMPPLQFLPAKAAYLTRDHILRGRLEELPAALREIKAQLSPPLDVIIDMSFVDYALEVDDPESAERYLEGFQQYLEVARLDILRYLSAQYEGRILAHKGEHEEAAERFGQALEAHAGSFLSTIDLLSPLEILVQQGRAYREAGDRKRAEASLEETLRRFPAYPEAHLELAKLHRERPREAREHLGRLFELWAKADESYPPYVEARELEAEL